jgi:hypothetical protein
MRADFCWQQIASVILIRFFFHRGATKIDWITRVKFFRNPPLALPLRAIDIFPRIDASAISTSIGMTKTKLQRRFMIGEALHTALTERRYSSIQPIHRLQNLAELGIIQ